MCVCVCVCECACVCAHARACVPCARALFEIFRGCFVFLVFYGELLFGGNLFVFCLFVYLYTKKKKCFDRLFELEHIMRWYTL